jgi:hypothetical protein
MARPSPDSAPVTRIDLPASRPCVFALMESPLRPAL